MDVIQTSNKDDVTIAVTGVIYQDTDPELGEVPDCDVKLDEGPSEDQQHMLKDLTRRYPDVFTDVPGDTNVIQHKVKMTDDTPIHVSLIPCRML